MELTSTFTYLVYQHALRIRFKSDAAEEGMQDNETPIGLITPTTADAGSSPVSNGVIETELESVAELDTLVSDEPPPAIEGEIKERTTQLTGKINNLLTGDLTTIVGSFDAVAIRMLTLGLCINLVCA